MRGATQGVKTKRESPQRLTTIFCHFFMCSHFKRHHFNDGLGSVNINKEIEELKRNQMEVLELKNTLTGIKTLLGGLNIK